MQSGTSSVHTGMPSSVNVHVRVIDLFDLNPASQIKLTVLPSNVSVIILLPLLGIPGSPQLTKYE